MPCGLQIELSEFKQNLQKTKARLNVPGFFIILLSRAQAQRC